MDDKFIEILNMWDFGDTVDRCSAHPMNGKEAIICNGDAYRRCEHCVISRTEPMGKLLNVKVEPDERC